ncbi:Na+/H+-dicarboxylate symporter [Parapedobacter composti]|uniref:Na+/H+-dicarboxylate symporter n=1 Tax=Parapedobacter composti TaxID=623281 RepID=A0A1I1DUH2_9SPHI|nr:dicarboxylate/amino acid:cation symporter [Parapedobacter composti]SFB78521.1 Na+/H+-dicarboxylate symporter [Parapedobacter composti]
MERRATGFLKNYGDILLLLLGIAVGSVVGMFFPGTVEWLKPVGDVFLNLLFASVVPLLFFAIASAVANIDGSQRLGRIISVMVAVFLGTVVIAAVCTIVALWLFPVEAPSTVGGPGTTRELLQGDPNDTWGAKLVRFVTVDEFYRLLSRENMLAFVIFSFLVGIAAMRSGGPGAAFRGFLASGNEVMKHLLILIMKVAPIGLGAYFAYQVGTIGPELFGFYAKPLGLYYVLGVCYFAVFFSLYAYMAGGRQGVSRYWRNNILPSATAISTCSSIATMPVNLVAAQRMGIPAAVANVVIPLGMTLHKNGSSMSSIVKIYVAFVLIGRDFFEPMTLLTAVGITVLVSIVAGGIPNGGYIGEMLMISVYGLPTEAIPAVLIIGTLVDPIATVLNATGDTVAAMLVSRFALGRNKRNRDGINGTD